MTFPAQPSTSLCQVGDSALWDPPRCSPTLSVLLWESEPSRLCPAGWPDPNGGGGVLYRAPGEGAGSEGG